MESKIVFNNDYLEHHGILGQKWGVRRYQNKDGSLTSAGKKRYGIKEYMNEASKAREKMDAAEIKLRGKRKSGEITRKEYKTKLKAAKEKSLEKWAENTKYSQDLKYLGLGAGISALSYGASKILEAKGKDVAASFLTGVSMGALEGATIAAGTNAVLRLKYSKK